jgi:hypothetical protein
MKGCTVAEILNVGDLGPVNSDQIPFSVLVL